MAWGCSHSGQASSTTARSSASETCFFLLRTTQSGSGRGPLEVVRSRHSSGASAHVDLLPHWRHTMKSLWAVGRIWKHLVQKFIGFWKTGQRKSSSLDQKLARTDSFGRSRLDLSNAVQTGSRFSLAAQILAQNLKARFQVRLLDPKSLDVKPAVIVS